MLALTWRSTQRKLGKEKRVSRVNDTKTAQRIRTEERKRSPRIPESKGREKERGSKKEIHRKNDNPLYVEFHISGRTFGGRNGGGLKPKGGGEAEKVRVEEDKKRTGAFILYPCGYISEREGHP